jgi:Transposase DDE domain
MRFPGEWYQMDHTIAHYLPQLRPAQRRGLTLWVYGTLLAQSACQNAVVTALLAVGAWHGLRQRLREWLYDGADKAAPCQMQVDVSLCFAPLLRWVLTWWQGSDLALALDATAHGDHVVVLAVSVLYRGSAIPVAWHVLPANQPGAWMPHLLRLLRLLRPAVPRSMRVLVLADRGLWSPRLWKHIRQLRWHPVLRLQETVSFQPLGQRRCPAHSLVPGPGYAWVGRGVAFRARQVRRVGTLVVVWAAAQEQPWVVLTDVPPERVGVCWYGLRVWIELGFRALKGMGWQWQQTRRTEPTRVARHWLVLAVAMLWVLAYGTRVEDATQQGRPPAGLRTPRPGPAHSPSAGGRQRLVSLFRLGLSWLRTTLGRGYLWRRLWLTPESWPASLPQLCLTYHLVA